MPGQVSQPIAERPQDAAKADPEPVLCQYETVARDAGARIGTWTRGDAVASSPLVLAAGEHPGMLTAIPRLGATGEAQPLVHVDGGFHAHADGTHETFGDDAEATLFGGILDNAPMGSSESAWASITIDRPRRIEGLLALCNAKPGSGDVQIGEDDDGANIDRTPDESMAAWPAPVTDDTDVLAVWPEAASAYTDPAQFVPRLLDALNQGGGHRLFYAPGIGLPHELALLSYAGIDVFDTHAVDRMADLGYLTTSDGVVAAANIKDAVATPAGLNVNGGFVIPCDLDSEGIRAFNRAALAAERDALVPRIRQRTLRHLVEARVRAHPESVALLRHVDKVMGAWLADRIPLADTGRVLSTSMEALDRPDIERYRQRMRDNYRPPANADILLLLPCSARKPYAKSRSHKSFKRAYADLYSASRVHEVIITSPIGVVPREMELTWPAANYDVPVTGNWDAVEREMIREQLRDLLSKADYKHVISHLGASTHDLVADLLPADTVQTGLPHPTRFECRMAMRDALFAACSDGNKAPSWPERRLAEAKALASWQYGPEAAEALFARADGTGARPPATRVLVGGRNGKQLCQVVPQKGLISMTMMGAQELYEAGHLKAVEIENFMPRGTVFAVGVKGADSDIAVGQDVALVHNGELRGVGIALMPGPEMGPSPRGGCVEVKHHV